MGVGAEKGGLGERTGSLGKPGAYGPGGQGRDADRRGEREGAGGKPRVNKRELLTGEARRWRLAPAGRAP